MGKQATIEQLRAQIDGMLSTSADTAASEPSPAEADARMRRAPVSGRLRGQTRMSEACLCASGEDEPPADREDAAARALSKIVALVNYSDRSEYGIRKRLREAGFSEDAIVESVARARDYGFIDDRRFAEQFIRSRLGRGKGAQGIERELKEQGIDVAFLEGWPDEFDIDDDAELARALGLLGRKPPHSKNLREGAYRKLVQSGYSSSIASRASRMWLESQASSV